MLPTIIEYKGNNPLLAKIKDKQVRLIDAAKMVDLKPKIISERLRRGWDLEKALLTPCNGTRTNEILNKVLEINGEKRTIAEWLPIYGITPQQFCVRLNLGWTVVKALTRPLSTPQDRQATREANSGQRAKTDIYADEYKQGKTITEIASSHGVEIATVFVCLKRRGLVKSKRNLAKRTETIKSDQYADEYKRGRKISTIADRHGVSTATVLDCLKRRGLVKSKRNLTGKFKNRKPKAKTQ